MSWYYAENNERRGPIEDAAFQALVASGAIKPDTLVWRDGMTDWVPYSRVQGQVGAAAGGIEATAAIGARTAGAGAKTCSQCGRIFAADELIFLAGRSVCAECKPLVVQQMMEGTDAGGAPFDSAAFLADLRARGGYRLDIGTIISNAWRTVTSNFWPCVGVTLLLYLILMVAQMIPCVGNLAPFILNGPIFGGLYLYFIRQLRGQPVTIGDAFTSFNQPHFGRLALAGTVQLLIIFAIAAVLVGPGLVLNWSQLQSNSSEPPMAVIIGGIIAFFPIAYFSIAWLLSFALIIDRRMDFWPAMTLSRQIINMNFFGWFGLLIVNFLITLLGVVALCVGVFVAMPITFCALMAAYEDIFSQSQRRAP